MRGGACGRQRERLAEGGRVSGWMEQGKQVRGLSFTGDLLDDGVHGLWGCRWRWRKFRVEGSTAVYARSGWG